MNTIQEGVQIEPTPVAETALARIREVGTRLREVLADVLREIGAPTSASKLARTLPVDPELCRKVVVGTSATDGLTAVYSLPGTDGLHSFCNAVADRIPQPITLRLRAAIDAVDRCTRDVARTRAEMLRMIAPEVPGQRTQAFKLARAALFRGAREYTGRSCDVQMTIAAAVASPDDEQHIDVGAILGVMGLSRIRPAMPICVGTGGTLAEISRSGRQVGCFALDGGPIGENHASPLVAEFCTQPPPNITSVRTPVGMTHVVDLDDLPLRRKIDLAFGTKMLGAGRHPLHGPRPYESFSSRVVIPAEHQLVDVYWARSLAASSIASVDTFFFGAYAEGLDWDQRWFDRHMDAGELQHLGVGISRCETPLYRRHPELTKRLFDALGWNPDDFVGYRCVQRYPPWSFMRVMGFDFSHAAR